MDQRSIPIAKLEFITEVWSEGQTVGEGQGFLATNNPLVREPVSECGSLRFPTEEEANAELEKILAALEGRE